MDVQTIFQAGNSNVVAIPKNILSNMQLKTGDQVIVEKVDEDTIVVKKSTSTKSKKSASKAEFQKWLKVFMDENGEILDELAQR